MGIDFNGVTEHLQCRGNSSINDVFDSATGGGGAWMFHGKLDDFGKNLRGRGLDKTGNDADGPHLGVRGVDGDNTIEFGHGFTGTNGLWRGPIGLVSIGVTHHFSVSWAKDLAALPALAIDGVGVTTTIIQNPSGTPCSDSGDFFRIGGGQGDIFAFDGTISDVRIYDRIVLEADIADIFHAQRADAIVDNLKLHFDMFGPHLVNVSTADVKDLTENGNDLVIVRNNPDFRDDPLQGVNDV